MPAPTSDAYLVHDDFALARGDEPVIARASREDQYAVYVTSLRGHLLQHLGALLADSDTAAFVMDADVEALYGAELVEFARACGCDVLTASVPAGERSKSLDQAVKLLEWLAASRLGRRDVVVNLGGGVVCDVGGWVASTYMRGVPYLNIPTTLLAMVDGALGGKLGVNHPVAKNLLGGFQQPMAVLVDVEYLRSLSRRHVAAGLAECVKKAVIASPSYFDFIEDNADALMRADPVPTTVLVRSAAAIKTALVARDPYELDLRRPLNFGHTVGHPVETVTGYEPLLHGEAVAFGMVVEARIAALRGWLGEETLERLITLLTRLDLPVAAQDLPAPIERGPLLHAMERVRLIRAGSLRWVLPTALGATAIADDVTDGEIDAALRAAGVE